MREIIEFATRQREELIDITDKVREVVRAGGVANGIVSARLKGGEP